MIAQLPPDVAAVIPPKYLVYATTAAVLLTWLGRAYTAVKNEGGLAAVWKSIVFGSTTTTVAESKKDASNVTTPVAR